jgi:hypothetical protein
MLRIGPDTRPVRVSGGGNGAIPTPLRDLIRVVQLEHGRACLCDSDRPGPAGGSGHEESGHRVDFKGRTRIAVARPGPGPGARLTEGCDPSPEPATGPGPSESVRPYPSPLHGSEPPGSARTPSRVASSESAAARPRSRPRLAAGLATRSLRAGPGLGRLARRGARQSRRRRTAPRGPRLGSPQGGGGTGPPAAVRQSRRPPSVRVDCDSDGVGGRVTVKAERARRHSPCHRRAVRDGASGPPVLPARTGLDTRSGPPRRGRTAGRRRYAPPGARDSERRRGGLAVPPGAVDCGSRAQCHAAEHAVGRPGNAVA